MNTSLDEPSSIRLSVTRAYRNPGMEINSVSSPSHSDSEPPNYYEATGATQVIYSTNGSGQIYASKGQPRTQSTASSANTSNTFTPNFSTITYQEPNDYLIWSLFTTIFCLLFGVPALVMSLRVRYYNSKGRYDYAYAQSKIARTLNIIGIFFGIFLATLSLFLLFFPRFF